MISVLLGCSLVVVLDVVWLLLKPMDLAGLFSGDE